MAYQETTGLTPEDVINKIAAFSAANGWTVDTNTLVGSVRTLVLHKSGDYIHIWNDASNNILISGSIGYVPGTAYNLQTGYAGNYSYSNLGAGPYTNVFMFADNSPSEHVYIAVELAGGIFRHIAFGMADKLGTWTGGTFFDATYWRLDGLGPNWNSFNRSLFDWASGTGLYGGMRCDIAADGKTNAWALFHAGATYRAFTGLSGGQSNQPGGTGYMTTQFYNRNAAPFSGQITVGTIRADVLRTGGLYSPACTFPNIRYLTMERYAPGQEITIGSDVWKVFPMCRKGVGSGLLQYSDNHAYAYKKVP